MNRCELFLKLWLEAAKDHVYFVPRKKNIKSLEKLGLTTELAKEILLSLTSADYYKGPEEDHDSTRSGEIWIFKKKLDENITLYIKIKLIKDKKGFIAKCLSFHQWEDMK